MTPRALRTLSTLPALWRSSHPGPTVVVTVLAVVLGVSAGLDAARLALLGGAVFAGQLSVGWSNDAIDARRDAAVGRADKPIARGEISARAVGVAAAVALVVALGMSAVLGPGFLGVHVVALASAWSYNAWLKRTAASALPFAISFGLFPSLATLARADPLPATLWASAAGAMLGVAVHFSNVLPDLDDDAATGIRGLPHRLGPRTSAVVAFVAVAAGAIAVAVGSVVPGSAGAGSAGIAPIVTAGLVIVLAIAIAGLVRAVRRPDRTVFRLVMLAALVLAVQLAVAGVSVAA